MACSANSNIADSLRTVTITLTLWPTTPGAPKREPVVTELHGSGSTAARLLQAQPFGNPDPASCPIVEEPPPDFWYDSSIESDASGDPVIFDLSTDEGSSNPPNTPVEIGEELEDDPQIEAKASCSKLPACNMLDSGGAMKDPRWIHVGNILWPVPSPKSNKKAEKAKRLLWPVVVSKLNGKTALEVELIVKEPSEIGPSRFLEDIALDFINGVHAWSHDADGIYLGDEGSDGDINIQSANPNVPEHPSTASGDQIDLDKVCRVLAFLDQDDNDNDDSHEIVRDREGVPVTQPSNLFEILQEENAPESSQEVDQIEKWLAVGELVEPIGIKEDTEDRLLQQLANGEDPGQEQVYLFLATLSALDLYYFLQKGLKRTLENALLGERTAYGAINATKHRGRNYVRCTKRAQLIVAEIFRSNPTVDFDGSRFQMGILVPEAGALQPRSSTDPWERLKKLGSELTDDVDRYKRWKNDHPDKATLEQRIGPIFDPLHFFGFHFA